MSLMSRCSVGASSSFDHQRDRNLSNAGSGRCCLMTTKYWKSLEQPNLSSLTNYRPLFQSPFAQTCFWTGPFSFYLEIQKLESPRRKRLQMKTQPAPSVAGDAEAQRFDNVVRKMFTVSKEEMQRPEAHWQKIQNKKMQPKKS